MKKYVAGLALIAMMAISGTSSKAQEAKEAPRSQRIMIVNIAKVLKDFKEANYKGAEITNKRQKYNDEKAVYGEQITKLQAEFAKANLPEQKKALQEQALTIQRKVEDIDRRMNEELTKLSNDTIVRVYQQIKGVIEDIAKFNNLDMVLAYPAATKVEDENSAMVATLMLQTPALIPFYHNKVDITEVVTATLNKKYPSPEPPATPKKGS